MSATTDLAHPRRGSFDRTRLRRARHVVCYWDGGGCILHNYASRVRAGGHYLSLSALDFFEDWTPAAAFYDRHPEVSPPLLGRLLRELARRSFLEREGAARAGADEALDRWGPWNPIAGFFHQATKDETFTDLAVVDAVLSERARTRPRPPLVKQDPRVPVVALPGTTGQDDSEFVEAMRGRRTWRRFARRPVPLDEVARLLDLSLRVQRWIQPRGEPPVPLKTSPSGGARHPVEGYVVAIRVKGLDRGLYHYDAAGHRLEALRTGLRRRVIDRYLAGQWWFRDAAFLLVLTGVFERSQWRYDYPRAYRAVLAEVGHVCQSFLLSASWRGLAPFCTMAIEDSTIERDLSLDGITESVLYVAGAGARPPGTDWAPWPPHDGQNPYLPPASVRRPSNARRAAPRPRSR